MTTATIEALKKAKRDEIAARAGVAKAHPVVPTEMWWEEPSERGTGEAVVEAKAVEKKDEWPNVLPATGGKMFSEVFPEAFKAFSENSRKVREYPDFPLPDYSGHAYPEWMLHYVPKSSDYVAEPELVYDAALAYTTGSVTHFVGPPGTGKSNGLPVLMASRLGLPLLRLGLNKKGMMFDDLIGREAIKTEDGHTVTGHRDGVLIPWCTHPCIILADEFSRANSEISNGLMSFMERDGCLVVENRDPPVIKRHPHCWILASDNVKGLGDGLGKFPDTELMDNAILDRFEVTLEVTYLTEAQQTKLVMDWFPGFPEKVAKQLAQLACLIQQSYLKPGGGLPVSCSPRTLRELARYSALHRSPKVAIRKVVMSKYSEEADAGAIAEMYQRVFGERWA